MLNVKNIFCKNVMSGFAKFQLQMSCSTVAFNGLLQDAYTENVKPYVN